MAVIGQPTTLSHKDLPGITGWIQTTDLGVYVCVKRDDTDDAQWIAVPNEQVGEQIITNTLTTMVTQAKFAAAAANPVGYTQPQQPQMTDAERAKAARKVRNATIRQNIASEIRDARAVKRLERACQIFPCPECAAGRNQPCVSIHGRNRLPSPHVSRIEQYQRKRGG